MTHLEKIVLKLTGINTVLNSSVPRDQWQGVLDAATDEIMCKISPTDIIKHMKGVYDKTAEEYEKNSHNKDIINELLLFMACVSGGSFVLDVGCATGRDALFMSISDNEYRNSLMGRIKNEQTTREKYAVPEKTFRVKGIDGSKRMLKMARTKTNQLVEQGLLTFQSSPIFECADIHNIDPVAFPKESRKYDGIWSCASLFTHTPSTLLDATISAMAWRLKVGGIFFTSYTNGLADGRRYNKLLLSSTGCIKYFSQPNPDEIAQLASKHGLALEAQAFSDMEVQGKVVKPNLFVSQFFRKTT